MDKNVQYIRNKVLTADSIDLMVWQHDCLSLNIPPGFGKSFGAKNYVKYPGKKIGFDVVIIATDKKENRDKYAEELSDINIPGAEILVLPARNPDECKNFEKIKTCYDNGWIEIASKICKDCTDECSYREGQERLRTSTAKLLIVITTQSYLLRNQFLRFMLLKKKILLILDEATFLTPSDKNTTLQIDERRLNVIIRKYRELQHRGRKLKDLADQGERARDGVINESEKTIHLGLMDEEILMNNGLPNYSEVFTIKCQRNILSWNGSLTVRLPFPLNAKRILVAATGASANLIRSVFPTKKVGEITLDASAKISPLSKFIRIETSDGTRTNFRKGNNSRKILVLFAQLTEILIKQGKRVLFISLQEFVPKVVEEMNLIISELKLSFTVCDAEHASEKDIPIIHYGATGTNRFEGYDCAFCLNSFNCNPETINRHMSFLRYYEKNYNITIETDNAGRHISGDLSPSERDEANTLYSFYESGVVIQAIGRIRPFTKEHCLVITMQRNEVVPGETVFNGLAEVREYFSIKTPSVRQRKDKTTDILQMRAQGLNKAEIALQLKIGRTTLYEYLKNLEKSPKNIDFQTVIVCCGSDVHTVRRAA